MGQRRWPEYQHSPWTPERTERLVRLREDTTMSVSEIAQELGVRKNVVSGKLRRLGLTDPARNPSHRRDGPVSPSAMRKRMKADGGKEALKLPVVDAPPPNGDIITHRSKECAFINDDGTWCCAPVQRGSSYCPPHHALCHRKKEGKDK